ETTAVLGPGGPQRGGDVRLHAGAALPDAALELRARELRRGGHLHRVGELPGGAGRSAAGAGGAVHRQPHRGGRRGVPRPRLRPGHVGQRAGPGSSRGAGDPAHLLRLAPHRRGGRLLVALRLQLRRDRGLPAQRRHRRGVRGAALVHVDLAQPAHHHAQRGVVHAALRHVADPGRAAGGLGRDDGGGADRRGVAPAAPPVRHRPEHPRGAGLRGADHDDGRGAGLRLADTAGAAVAHQRQRVVDGLHLPRRLRRGHAEPGPGQCHQRPDDPPDPGPAPALHPQRRQGGQGM
ncbi:MAG: hypothetical protein AVDCRST_MAG48-1704, partial [uncultured Friedmanniella sp.]